MFSLRQKMLLWMYTLLSWGWLAGSFLLPLPSALRLLMLVSGIVSQAVLGMVAILICRIRYQKKMVLKAGGERILILAPHQDDGVAIAGGYAVQTMQMGGEVHILYLTRGDDDRTSRPAEAKAAWAVFGDREVNMSFLDYHNVHSFVDRGEIDTAIGQIRAHFIQVRPEIIFIPLYEGGHFQHDILNYMAGEALKGLDFSPAVYEAPIYNFYMSFSRTPKKIISGFMRFFPGLHFDYPPEPVNDEPLFFLEMSKEQRQKKNDIILGFKSQNPDQLLRRWNFEDCYQRYTGHDYSKPPFNYSRSMAAWLDWLKPWPLIGFLARRVMVWTRTIHPDANVRITQIPN